MFAPLTDDDRHEQDGVERILWRSRSIYLESSSVIAQSGQLRFLRQYLCSSSAVSVLQQVSNRLRGLEFCLYDVTTELFSLTEWEAQRKRLALTLVLDEVFSITHSSSLSSLKLLEHLEVTYGFTDSGHRYRNLQQHTLKM